jgi:hypothetical protein
MAEVEFLRKRGYEAADDDDSIGQAVGASLGDSAFELMRVALGQIDAQAGRARVRRLRAGIVNADIASKSAGDTWISFASFATIASGMTFNNEHTLRRRASRGPAAMSRDGYGYLLVPAPREIW